MMFLLPFLYVKKDVYVSSFFPQLNSGDLPAECFPLTYNLNDLKSIVSSHLLSLRSV